MYRKYTNMYRNDGPKKHTEAFENLKQKITEILCLAHYNLNYPNVITTEQVQKVSGPFLARTTGR